jgi:hypothetical protein
MVASQLDSDATFDAAVRKKAFRSVKENFAARLFDR